MKRTNLTFDKQLFCGISILDISETLMYDFHLGHTKDKYGSREVAVDGYRQLDV